MENLEGDRLAVGPDGMKYPGRRAPADFPVNGIPARERGARVFQQIFANGTAS
jgi:hypothetical protein